MFMFEMYQSAGIPRKVAGLISARSSSATVVASMEWATAENKTVANQIAINAIWRPLTLKRLEKLEAGE